MMMVSPSKTFSSSKCFNDFFLVFEKSCYNLVEAQYIGWTILICERQSLFFWEEVCTCTGIVCNETSSSLSSEPFSYHSRMCACLLGECFCCQLSCSHHRFE